MRYIMGIFIAALFTAWALPAAAAEQSAAQQGWLAATGEKLPRWRGFNLLEKFMLGSGRKPFVEDDFR